MVASGPWAKPDNYIAVALSQCCNPMRNGCLPVPPIAEEADADRMARGLVADYSVDFARQAMPIEDVIFEIESASARCEG